MIRVDKLMKIIKSTNKIFMTKAIQTEKKAKQTRIHNEKTSKDRFL